MFTLWKSDKLFQILFFITSESLALAVPVDMSNQHGVCCLMTHINTNRKQNLNFWGHQSP